MSLAKEHGMAYSCGVNDIQIIFRFEFLQILHFCETQYKIGKLYLQIPKGSKAQLHSKHLPPDMALRHLFALVKVGLGGSLRQGRRSWFAESAWRKTRASPH